MRVCDAKSAAFPQPLPTLLIMQGVGLLTVRKSDDDDNDDIIYLIGEIKSITSHKPAIRCASVTQNAPPSLCARLRLTVITMMTIEIYH